MKKKRTAPSSAQITVSLDPATRKVLLALADIDGIPVRCWARRALSHYIWMRNDLLREERSVVH